MSWKQRPDGQEKLAEFLREVKQGNAAQRPTDPSTRTPRSRTHRLRWILVLALAAVVWLLFAA